MQSMKEINSVFLGMNGYFPNIENFVSFATCNGLFYLFGKGLDMVLNQKIDVINTTLNDALFFFEYHNILTDNQQDLTKMVPVSPI